MRLELLFALSSFLVLPFWLLMIALPQWSVTRSVMASPLVLLPLPVLYLVLVALHWELLVYLVDHPDLRGVAVVLGRPEGALIGWLHLLALDFFAGRWIYLDSQERKVHVLAMAPILWATLLAGPVGLVMYLVVRSFAGEGAGEPVAEEAAEPAAAVPHQAPAAAAKPHPEITTTPKRRVP
jgi:hypothetical protein